MSPQICLWKDVYERLVGTSVRDETPPLSVKNEPEPVAKAAKLPQTGAGDGVESRCRWEAGYGMVSSSQRGL
jgi:hypothetical protein